MSELEVRLITDREKIKEIYDNNMTQDFPEDERTPWKYLIGMHQKGEYACYGIYRDDAFLGYAFFICLSAQGKKNYLLDYLAVAECYRNDGIGAQFLNQLGTYISDADCVVVEVEDPDAADSEEERTLRKRRIGFYERNGVRLTTARAELRGVVYRLMEIPVCQNHSDEEVRAVYASIYEQLIPEEYLKKVLRMLPYASDPV